jgi:hypothetical protein
VNPIKTAITVISTVMAARTALARVRQAREDGDQFELVDAALNALVVVSGVIIIVRRLRRGEDEA